MKKRKKGFKKNKLKKALIISSCILSLGLGTGTFFLIKTYDTKGLPKEEKTRTMYLASNTNMVELYQMKEEKIEIEEGQDNKEQEMKLVLVFEKEIPRGAKVVEYEKEVVHEKETYRLVEIENQEYYVKKDQLVEKEDNVVLEKVMYVRSATSILETSDDIKIVSLASKGEELEIINYEKIDENGKVSKYRVKQGEIEGYVYGKYLSYTKEEALKNYMAEQYDAIHSKISNAYNGGEAIKLDFYPNEKPSFKNNVMPESVHALYLNCGSNVIKNIDAYIAFARDTKINTFVIDIKDNESPAYPAKTFEKFSPTNYRYAINSYEDYKTAITKLKDAGFYVIGRITTFKDSFYVKDHPEDAILNKSTNQAYLHNGSYWPSAYNRNVWYYTLSLAKEAVEEFGFNEINFDYVRFPDRMNSVASIIDLKNVYSEDKTQAIQRFTQYAKDVLHELEVYVSVDVFGETTNGSYTTAYGQYWPAISNEVDVISGMPYPDHFAAYSYGLAKPWNNPYQLMNYWARYAMDRQKEIPTPAKVRTWIQAYDVMRYVDSNGISYGAKQIEDQVRGLYDAGATGGYITWLSNSSLSKYQSQKQAFQIDYGKEYLS